MAGYVDESFGFLDRQRLHQGFEPLGSAWNTVELGQYLAGMRIITAFDVKRFISDRYYAARLRCIESAAPEGFMELIEEPVDYRGRGGAQEEEYEADAVSE